MRGPGIFPTHIYGTLKGSRRFFSPEDDTILRRIKETNPNLTWPEVSELMPGFNTRQLRERWCHYLSPSLNTTMWTTEEDQQLIKLHHELGSRWGEIGARMGNRSPPDVKNRYQTIRHRRRAARRSRAPSSTDRAYEQGEDGPPPQEEKAPPSQNQTDFSIKSILL
jgi:DNA-binding transcriptional MerR regulator